MSTIVVTRPCPPVVIDPDYLITTIDTKPSKTGIAELLIKLGQKVIKNDLPSQWMRLSQITALCRRYRLYWQHGTPRAKALEAAIYDYYDNHIDLMGCGVSVQCKTERNDKKRREEFHLRFRRLNPDGTIC